MIAELTPQLCPSLSCTSLQRRCLISSTAQMEQPRISTSLRSPGLSSSPGGGEVAEQKEKTTTLSWRCFLFVSCWGKSRSLTVLQRLHQAVRVAQHAEVDEGLRDAVVGEHGEPVHVDQVSLPSGLHDAPGICHQDLSSLVE